jgi:small subunit ribosomal protein S6
MSKMRDYETTYIMASDADESEKQRVAERIRAIIETQFGGSILRVDEWGRRQLSFPIGKYGQGVYTYVRYSAPGKTIAELERVLRIFDSVLKFLSVRLEPGEDTGARPDSDENAYRRLLDGDLEDTEEEE